MKWLTARSRPSSGRRPWRLAGQLYYHPTIATAVPLTIATAATVPTPPLVTAAFPGGGLAGFVVKPHGEANAVAFHVNIHDFHFHYLPGANNVVRVGHVLVGQGGHVHQAVVVHSHVDERAEGGHIGDGSPPGSCRG